MSDPQPMGAPSAKRGRSLTGFYVAVGVVIALGLFGGWFWKTWTVWWFDADEAKRRQVEAATRLGVPVEKSVDLGDGVKLELVLIPAGRFKMGSPEDEKDRNIDEEFHWVRITKPFYMGQYEVTQEVWQKVMGANPGRFKGAKNPVENVSWDDCQEFLKKLNGSGQCPVQFRLPTEAEWEWACRAGTRTRFCSGDDEGGLGKYAWYGANSGRTTYPVGTKRANAWGLFDCYGNVMEWCGDWCAEYNSGWMPKADPTGPTFGERGSSKALRGGCAYGTPRSCRSAGREGLIPHVRDNLTGLRVAASLSKTP